VRPAGKQQVTQFVRDGRAEDQRRIDAVRDRQCLD
jgi:hypothetical protein